MGRHPIAQEELLDSPARKAILDCAREQPGIPLGELRLKVDLGWGALYHHLHKLEEGALIEVRNVGRLNLVYLRGAEEQRDILACSLLRGTTARLLAEEILRRPGRSVPDLVETTGESPRVVYYHVKRLAEAGLITSPSRFRHVELSPSPHLPRFLAMSAFHNSPP
jgi:DNA-binding transcriptional ArsR family regulator